MQIFGIHTCQQTLAVQESHRRPRLKTPQRLNTAALFQIQQLDEDDRIDVQEAAVAWTNSTSSSTATTAT